MKKSILKVGSACLVIILAVFSIYFNADEVAPETGSMTEEREAPAEKPQRMIEAPPVDLPREPEKTRMKLPKATLDPILYVEGVIDRIHLVSEDGETKAYLSLKEHPELIVTGSGRSYPELLISEPDDTVKVGYIKIGTNPEKLIMFDNYSYVIQ